MIQSGKQLAQRGDKEPNAALVPVIPRLLHVVLWKWHQPGFRFPYTSEYVNIVAQMVHRHRGRIPVRIICVTDDPAGVTECETFPLWDDHDKLANRSGTRLPSCYRRLKLFDQATQIAMGISPGDRVTSLDLDTVLTGDMTPHWSKPHPFVGWAVRGTHHLRVFNGSMWMFTAGEQQHIWNNFDPNSTPDRCHRAGYLGSDQSWLSYNFAKSPHCGTWTYPHAVSYPREVARRPILSKATSIVFFHGGKKPWDEKVQRDSPWIKQHWKLNSDALEPAAVA